MYKENYLFGRVSANRDLSSQLTDINKAPSTSGEISSLYNFVEAASLH